jgi:multidrug efflux pump
MLRPSLNGKPAVFISVYQQPGANALAVARACATRWPLEKSFPDGIAYEVSLDTTKYVRSRSRRS